MRGIRGKMLATTAVLAAGALAGCGAETHENDPRPPVPQVVSVSVSDSEIEVSPEGVGLPGQLPVNINQNEDAPVNQADREAPAVVQVAISNLTSRDTELVIEGTGEFDERSEPLTAQGSGSFMASLPTGIYRFSSPASDGSARLVVGRSRVSSSSDLLTP